MGSGRGTANRPAQRGAVPDPTILELRYRPESRTGDSDSEEITRAELARQLNASIYTAAQSAHQQDEEFELTFFCACGCLTEVKRSLRDYVTRGAIVIGHAHPTGPHLMSTTVIRGSVFYRSAKRRYSASSAIDE